MKYLFFLLQICFSSCFCAMSTSGQESDHFQAEFWQCADGKYNVKIIQFENEEGINHIYVFDKLIHSQFCECLK